MATTAITVNRISASPIRSKRQKTVHHVPTQPAEISNSGITQVLDTVSEHTDDESVSRSSSLQGIWHKIRFKWTKKEDDAFFACYERYGPGCWKKFTEDKEFGKRLKHRSSVQIKDRFRTLVAHKRIVDGKINYNTLTQLVSLSSPPPYPKPRGVCRMKWSAQEDDAFFACHHKYGPSFWAKYKKDANHGHCFKYRSNIDIKDRFRTLVNQGRMDAPE